MAWSQEIPLWEIKDLAKELALRGDSFSVNRGIINIEPVTVYIVVRVSSAGIQRGFSPNGLSDQNCIRTWSRKIPPREYKRLGELTWWSTVIRMRSCNDLLGISPNSWSILTWVIRGALRPDHEKTPLWELSRVIFLEKFTVDWHHESLAILIC